MIGMSAGSIRNLWSAIEDRHRQFGYTPPLAMRGGDFSRYSKAVASIKGMPSRLIFPVGVHHVKQMLELVALSPAQTRDVLMCVLGTVMCMRVNEVDQLQICDVLWRFDAGFHPRYSNTLACRVYKRKQDQARKGLYPRAVKQSSHVFARLQTMRVWQSMRTTPRAVRQVTNAVLNSLQMIGVDTKHYSGISMRRGGISAGLAARVREPILFLQSGHGSNCAARNYMVPRDPHVLYETYLAFGLNL